MSEVIDHVGIRVSDLAASRRMYAAALAELGFTVLGEVCSKAMRTSYSGATLATTSRYTTSGARRAATV